MTQDSINAASPRQQQEVPRQPAAAAPDSEPAPPKKVAVATSGNVIAKDTVATDTVAADTTHVAHVYGITLTPPPVPKVEANAGDTTGMSWIIGALILLFCIIGIRIHNSRRYLSTLVHNLTDVRLRTNAFDETVRETSFMVLLNLLWSCSAGVLLYGLLRVTTHVNPTGSFSLPLTTHPAASIAICMGVAFLYTCFMSLSYMIVGTVFAGKTKAGIWLRGYTSGQGLLSFLYFLLALLSLSHQEWNGELLWIAAGGFILTKIVFIWKGFRIFFTQISSWVLFLYYLCSLEIVPLILTYLAAILLCGLLH